MWFDRLTQVKTKELPSLVELGRFQWVGKGSECLNGHSSIHPKDLLISDGLERCQLRSNTYSFSLPNKDKRPDIDLFCNAITTISKQLEVNSKLISPILPAAVVDAESHLLELEFRLEQALDKGHLHQISRNPRLDIRYDEEVTDVTRAKRLARGALVHLASHSECWQRQTLSGIVPKKVKARFSEDDFNIYENIVYARLLDKLDRHLNKRITTIESLNDTLEQALEFYTDSATLHHKVRDKICKLWGQTFDEEATSATLELLEDTLNRLRDMHLCIRNLKQSSLYLLVARNAQVEGGLHRTNILNHDPHYRHLAILWDELSKYQQNSTRSPIETFLSEQKLADYYNQFSGLVLQHAVQDYLDYSNKGLYFNNELNFEWAGRKLSIKKDQLGWKLLLLVSGSEAETLLHIVPWLNFTEIPRFKPASDNTLIAWPGLDTINNDSPTSGNYEIAISPMDLYCIERIGWIIDQRLNRVLLKNYSKPIEKIPQAPLKWIESQSLGSSIEIHDSPSPSIKVFEDLSDNDLRCLEKQLDNSNAIYQKNAVRLRVMEIRTLQACPICDSKTNDLHGQGKNSFRVECSSCQSSWYLKSNDKPQEYQIELQLKGVENSFAARGRWFQA